MASEDPKRRSAFDTAADDRRIQSAVLGLLLQEHPAHLTLNELKLALNGEDAQFSADDQVTRAIRELVGCGLVHQAGPFIVPSRAARQCNLLETG